VLYRVVQNNKFKRNIVYESNQLNLFRELEHCVYISCYLLHITETLQIMNFAGTKASSLSSQGW